MNVGVYKDLNIECYKKKNFVTRTQCKNTLKPYSSRAYCLFYACIRNDFVCDGNRACRATCRVPGSTTNIVRTSKTATSTTVGDKTAMHSTRKRFKEALRHAHTYTLSFRIAKSPQATADQHDQELVPLPSHHSPL